MIRNIYVIAYILSLVKDFKFITLEKCSEESRLFWPARDNFFNFYDIG